MAKILKNLAEAQSVFNSLGIRYTMKTFRYCAENEIDISNLKTYTMKNLLDMVMYGTPDISPDQAYEIIEKGTEQGLSYPMLHTLAVKKAYDDGFFMSEADTKLMSEMDIQSPDVLKIILPTITQELSSMSNFTESMKKAL